MHRLHRAASVAAITVLSLSACHASADKPAAPAPTNKAAAPAAPAAPTAPVASHGTPAEVKLKNGDGSTFTLAEVPGKVKVVNFWATWCAPCIGEMPDLNAISKKHAADGVTFVAVSVDEGGAADVEPVLKKGKLKIDFRVAYASLEDTPFGVTAPIPDTLVFDAQNRLVEHFDEVVDPAKLEAAIAKALAGGAK